MYKSYLSACTSENKLCVIDGQIQSFQRLQSPSFWVLWHKQKFGLLCLWGGWRRSKWPTSCDVCRSTARNEDESISRVWSLQSVRPPTHVDRPYRRRPVLCQLANYVFASLCLIYNTAVIRPVTLRQRMTVGRNLILLSVRLMTFGFAGKCFGAGGRARWVATAWSRSVARRWRRWRQHGGGRQKTTRVQQYSFNECDGDRWPGLCRAEYCDKRARLRHPIASSQRSVYVRHRSHSSIWPSVRFRFHGRFLASLRGPL